MHKLARTHTRREGKTELLDRVFHALHLPSSGTRPTASLEGKQRKIAAQKREEGDGGKIAMQESVFLLCIVCEDATSSMMFTRPTMSSVRMITTLLLFFDNHTKSISISRFVLSHDDNILKFKDRTAR